MYRWDRVQKRDRLLGCSLTGWQDMVNATGLDRAGQAELLDELRAQARKAADEMANQLGGNRSLLVTTIKPEETLLHFSNRTLRENYFISPGVVSPPPIRCAASARSWAIRCPRIGPPRTPPPRCWSWGEGACRPRQR